MVRMKMRTIQACALVVLVSLPAGAAGLAAGCNSSANPESTSVCANNCDVSNNCLGATIVDCASKCSDDASLNMASGCTTPYNAEQTCVADLSDPCTSTSPCSKQLSDYTSCIQAFCTVMPTPEQCNVP
jgi:hypothetical protein